MNAAMIDDIDELFLLNDWPTKGIQPFFQSWLLSEILIIEILQHLVSRI